MTDIVKPDGTPASRYGQVKVPNIEIVGPRVMVAPRPKREYTTDTGIVVPEFAQEDFQEGVVVATGDGTILPSGEKLPPRVEVGYAVIYAKYAGAELALDDFRYLIINEADIRCILTYVGRVFEVRDDPPLHDDAE